MPLNIYTDIIYVYTDIIYKIINQTYYNTHINTYNQYTIYINIHTLLLIRIKTFFIFDVLTHFLCMTKVVSKITKERK